MFDILSPSTRDGIREMVNMARRRSLPDPLRSNPVTVLDTPEHLFPELSPTISLDNSQVRDISNSKAQETHIRNTDHRQHRFITIEDLRRAETSTTQGPSAFITLAGLRSLNRSNSASSTTSLTPIEIHSGSPTQQPYKIQRSNSSPNISPNLDNDDFDIPRSHRFSHTHSLGPVRNLIHASSRLQYVLAALDEMNDECEAALHVRLNTPRTRGFRSRFSKFRHAGSRHVQRQIEISEHRTREVEFHGVRVQMALEMVRRRMRFDFGFGGDCDGTGQERDVDVDVEGILAGAEVFVSGVQKGGGEEVKKERTGSVWSVLSTWSAGE